MACLAMVKVVMGAFLGLAAMFGFHRFSGYRLEQIFNGNADGQVIDTTDCYFDPACHPKVDWDKVGEMKKEIFSKLKVLKDQNDAEAGKQLLTRMHAGFAEAGVPDDRIDYILTKWVEYGYPHLLYSLSKSSITVSGFGCENGYGEDNNQEYTYRGTTKDGRPVYRGTQNPDRYIYYDSYCADDTKEPRWLLGGEPNMDREFNLNTHDGEGCENDFSIVSDSMHLPGGQQKVAWKWCGDHGFHDSASVSIIYEIRGKAAAIPGSSKDVRVGIGKASFYDPSAALPHEDNQCRKYEKWGTNAAKGCKGCVTWYPGRVDGCMKCGSTCNDICPMGSSFECYRGAMFVGCHKKCMLTESEGQDPLRPDVINHRQEAPEEKVQSLESVVI